MAQLVKVCVQNFSMIATSFLSMRLIVAGSYGIFNFHSVSSTRRVESRERAANALQ